MVETSVNGLPSDLRQWEAAHEYSHGRERLSAIDALSKEPGKVMSRRPREDGLTDDQTRKPYERDSRSIGPSSSTKSLTSWNSRYTDANLTKAT